MSDIDQTYDSQADDSRYDEAKRWTYLLTGIGVAIWVWVGFIPKAQEAAVWTAMAFPFACLFVGERYAGIIKFNKKKGDPDPSIATAFFLPAIGLFFKAMQAWHVVEYTNFWGSFAIAFLTIAIASVAISSEIRRNISSMFLCLVFCGFYGYGAVLDVNGMLATPPSRLITPRSMTSTSFAERAPLTPSSFPPGARARTETRSMSARASTTSTASATMSPSTCVSGISGYRIFGCGEFTETGYFPATDPACKSQGPIVPSLDGSSGRHSSRPFQQCPRPFSFPPVIPEFPPMCEFISSLMGWCIR